MSVLDSANCNATGEYSVTATGQVCDYILLTLIWEFHHVTIHVPCQLYWSRIGTTKSKLTKLCHRPDGSPFLFQLADCILSHGSGYSIRCAKVWKRNCVKQRLALLEFQLFPILQCSVRSRIIHCGRSRIALHFICSIWIRKLAKMVWFDQENCWMNPQFCPPHKNVLKHK